MVVYFHHAILSEEPLKKEEAIKIHRLHNKSKRGLGLTGDVAKAVRNMLFTLLASGGFDNVLELIKILNYLSKSANMKYSQARVIPMRQQQKLYEAILDKKLDKRNFINKFNCPDILVKLDEKDMTASRKGA